MTQKIQKTKRFKGSVVIPCALVAYLLFMAYYGRNLFFTGQYLHYFGVIGVTLAIIVILHFSLKKKEKLREKREQEMLYGATKSDSKPLDEENSPSNQNVIDKE